MRNILYIILFFVLYKIAKAILFPLRSFNQQKNKDAFQGNEMVLDPVCQSYFSKKDALNIKMEGEIIYFCSEGCREKFLKTVSSR